MSTHAPAIARSARAARLWIWLVVLAVAACQPTKFQQAIGTARDDSGSAIAATSDGGYVATGATTLEGGAGIALFLVRVTDTGEARWIRAYPGDGSARGYGVQATSDGGFVVAGGTWSAAGAFMYLLKTDADGLEVWHQTYAVSGESAFARAVTLTPDGGYLIAGGTGNGYGGRAMLLATDDTGLELWRSFPIGPAGYSSEALAIANTSDGGYVIGGGTWLVVSPYPPFSATPFVIRVDATGGAVWSAQPTTRFPLTTVESLVVNADGSTVAAGVGSLSDASSQRFQLWKLDAAGQELWHRDALPKSPRIAWDYGLGLAATQAGYVIAGTSCTIPCTSSSLDAVLEAVDPDGNLVREARIDGADRDAATAVLSLVDGGAAFAGFTSSYGAGGSDLYLVTTNPDFSTGPPPG